MKFGITALLSAACFAVQAYGLSIPETYLYKCDAIASKSERIGCMQNDLATLEEIKENVAELYRGNPHFRKHVPRHHSRHHLTGDDPAPAPKPAPKPDPNKGKIAFTSSEWYIFIFEVMLAYYCC